VRATVWRWARSSAKVGLEKERNMLTGSEGLISSVLAAMPSLRYPPAVEKENISTIDR